MVHIFYTYCKDLKDPLEYPESLQKLPGERIEKILRYKNAEKRKQSLGAGLLLAQVLASYGYSYEDIYYGEKGKPRIKGLWFNVSHSKDVVICVVSDKGEVGCDIEFIEAEAPYKIAKRYFCESELRHLETQKDELKNSWFYHIWTMKESYTKMTGEGLGIGLNSFEVSIDDDAAIYRNGQRCECYVKEYMLSGYAIAVCSEDEHFVDDMIYLTI